MQFYGVSHHFKINYEINIINSFPIVEGREWGRGEREEGSEICQFQFLMKFHFNGRQYSCLQRSKHFWCYMSQNHFIKLLFTLSHAISSSTITPACPYLLWAEWKQQRTTTKNKMIEVTTRTTAPRTLRTEEERNESEDGSWEGTERERKRNRETERER